jgi:Mlc titration factor MtfA (ptsG expression regulator)
VGSDVAFGVLVVIAVALVLWWALQDRWAEHRRAHWRALPFPAPWRRILRRRVPMVARLPPPLQRTLKGQVQALLAEVPIIGCRGLVVTDEMRVTIAAQASLLLLGGTRRFENLRQILLYPDTFVAERPATLAGGVQQPQRHALAGESWSQGQVILSWDAVRDGAALPDDGQNVVLHEFAHQLDQANGPANGAPVLPSTAHAAQWAAVMGEAWARLQAALARGDESCLGAYAATSEAEFFACATEVFFERPLALRQEYPGLHVLLRGYFGVDPEAWTLA